VELTALAYSESSSGTYEFFKVMLFLNLPATGAIVQAVGQTKEDYRYIGLAYETRSKTIGGFHRENFIEPCCKRKDKTYRTLFYMYDKAKPFKSEGKLL
jgi:phosphate transport system substrate-binding protein